METIELKKVNSSQVDAMGWKNDLLMVRFTSGAVYMYENVSYELYKSIAEADSVGHALNENLKYKSDYPCTKLSA